MPQNLYQIDEQIKNIINQADDDGCFDVDAFNKLTMLKADKQLNIIKFIKHCQNDEELIDDEIDRLKNLKKQAEKRTDWLKSYLANSMKIDGVRELDFAMFKAKFRKNPLIVEIRSEEHIPEEFFKVKIERTVNKTMLKEYLELADVVDGKVTPRHIDGVEIVQEERLAIF